ncbi:hypothetical protein [uncultured Microbacterium sp.]|uniref:hypothetical protein n=1 Tax=uncultured Microbacterium sp. TaxID=191216 RepID=UPI00260375F8|nr:hypothetical protein [uncultured Microbacterium sp.]
MTRGDFGRTRGSIVAIAIVVGLISLGGLVLLEFAKADMPAWLYAAGTNVLAVLFGLAVVSFAWEFLVRQSHSTDLRHYLRLGASVAQSGLQEVTTRSQLDWSRLLSSANEISVLTHNGEWLERNMYTLRDIATRRSLGVTVAVPSQGSAVVGREAVRRGSSADKVSEGIIEVTERAARLWREAKDGGAPLRAGSKLSVVEHDVDVDYEVITIDRVTVVTLAAPDVKMTLRDRVAFVYEQSPEEYPTSFFRTHVSGLSALNRLEEVTA